MQYEEIQNELRGAVRQLIRNDRFLLKYAVREEAISHRIAVYLEQRFTEYNVDCEYNSDLDSKSGRKQVLYGSREEESEVRPDIIVHHRGLNGSDHNKLVVEIKKSSSAESELPKDREKLKSFTATNQETHLQYCCGVLIILGVKSSAGNVMIEWYKNGEREHKEEMER